MGRGSYSPSTAPAGQADNGFRSRISWMAQLPGEYVRLDYSTNVLIYKRFKGKCEYFKVSKGGTVRQGWREGWMIMGKMIPRNQKGLKL